MQDLTYQLLYYLKGCWRYRWWTVAVAWVVAVVGWAVVWMTPNRYEANARVYVDTQSVLRPLLAGVAVQPNVDQIVGMMSRTLVSRPNLEKVVRMADLDIKTRSTKDREDLLDRLSKRLEIKSSGQANLYTISFSDRNPQEAKRVVQSLLTIFVEGSLGDKRKDSDSARRFIDDQLKSYAEKLNAAENAVTDFKRRHMGMMPGGGPDFYQRLSEAQAALTNARLELKEAENGRDSLKRQLTEDFPSLLEEQAQPAAEPASPEVDARILDLQKRLDSLRMTYTERHPDIVAILRMIDQLKEQKEREAKARKPVAAPPQTGAMRNPYLQQIRVSLAEAEASVASLKARVAEFEKRHEAISSAANAIPQIETEFKQLTRDYEVTRKNYEMLLARREQAQISGDMESNANIVDFRVIDPPAVPAAPSWPNRPLLMSAVLVAAIAAGLGFALLLSQLRPTVNDERKLREIAGLPVFGSVSMVWTDKQKSRRRKGVIAFIASIFGLLSAYGAVMAALFVIAARA